MVSLSSKNEGAYIDEDVDDISHEKHKQLLITIASKTKRKIQPTTRNEPSLQVSEYHLSNGQQKTNVDDLTNALLKKAPQIRQKIQVAKSNKKLLQKPFDKVHAEKIKRAVAYDNFKKHISRWSAVIKKNKSADQLRFPLKNGEIEVFDNRMVDFTKGFSEPTDLQKKISNLLQSSEIVQQKQNNLKMSWMEKEKEKYPLTLKELLEKRKSMAKFRVQESYRHAKAHRQNKIKSKQYHRLLRKEKTKVQIKEFEKLQKVDPVAALEKLNVIEKTRAEERASLRHKSTGQWARNHVVRAKYDKDSRIALAEQLRKSKELTQKVGQSFNETDNSDDSDNDEHIEIPKQVIDSNNPWLAERKEFTNFMTGYKHFVENNLNIIDENKQNNNESNINESTIKNKIQSIDRDGKKGKKIKNIAIEDLDVSFDDNDVEILRIITPQKKNDNTYNNTIKCKTKINDVDKNMKIDSNIPYNKTNNKLEVIHTTAGKWFVSLDNINISSKKNKIHKDVENTFKSVETELKNKINKKLVELNKVDVKQPFSEDSMKPKNKQVDSIYIKNKNKRLKAEFNEALHEDNKTLNTVNYSNTEDDQESNIRTIEKPIKKIQNIDPTEFLQVIQTNLESEEMAHIEDHIDDKEDNEQDKLIAEAFADDDIVNEFKEEKKKLVEQSKSKIETVLPGWGSWAGPNIKKRISKRRTNMGMFRTPAKPPRKDFNREKVIIHENADDAIKPHLVSELPYPFKDIEEYEDTIKTPVGRTWVPETVFHKLTAPPVVTQMGQIIDPIDENSVVKIELNE